MNAARITKTCFVIYLMVVGWVLVFKLGVHFSYMDHRHVNLVPFGDAIAYASRVDYTELILNVLVFIPFGIYSKLLWAHRAVVFQVSSFLVFSFLIEVIQYTFAIGALDATDLFTNGIGGLLGWGLMSVLDKVFSTTIRLRWWINVLAVLATVFVVILLTLLKLNMLPIRYQ